MGKKRGKAKEKNKRKKAKMPKAIQSEETKRNKTKPA